MKNLISMVDFVLQFDKPAGYFEDQNDFLLCQVDYMGKVINYANFLKQHLTIGMFVPCVDNEPFNYSIHGNQKEFEKAKEKVLFKDFPLDAAIHHIGQKRTIEYLSQPFFNQAILTESALKQIGI